MKKKVAEAVSWLYFHQHVDIYSQVSDAWKSYLDVKAFKIAQCTSVISCHGVTEKIKEFLRDAEQSKAAKSLVEELKIQLKLE